MKIVHIYTKNVQMFADAVEGTDCRLNASQDLDYLVSSLQQFNARDVLGLILFANPLTKKCLKLIQKFDDLFVFKRFPIVIISDEATALKEAGYFRTKHSDVYCIDSEDNSISDIELNAVFTTLLIYSDEPYDLSVIPDERKVKEFARTHGERKEAVMSPQLIELLNTIGRGDSNEGVSGGRRGSRPKEGEGLPAYDPTLLS